MENKTPGGLTARQASAICFVALLPPATRLLPGLCSELAGRAAWLCPIAALPFLLLTAVFIAPDSASLKLVSELIAPGLNLIMLFGLVLPALLIGRLRGRL